MRLRLVSLGSTLLTSACLACIVLSAPAAKGASLVYQEDFFGETAFPTTPEVNSIGLVGLDSSASGDPAPPAPTPDGVTGLVDLSVAGSGGAGNQQVVVGSPSATSFGSARIGVHGHFSGFESVFAGAGGGQVGVVLGQSGGANTAVAMLSVGSGTEMDLFILEDDSGDISNQQILSLTPTLRELILNGAAFDLELRVDMVNSEVIGMVSVGPIVFAAPAMGLNAMTGDSHGIGAFTQIWGDDDLIRVNLNELSATLLAPGSGWPFDRMEPQKTSLKFFHSGWDSFHFSTEFDLNEQSDGIDPETEEVTVSFGTYTETLPAGAFSCTGSDCSYESGGPGITRATMNDGFLEFRARHVDLSGTANPVEIAVQIGNDSGTAITRLGGGLALCGLGFELVFLLPPLMWIRRRRGRGRPPESFVGKQSKRW